MPLVTWGGEAAKLARWKTSLFDGRKQQTLFNRWFEIDPNIFFIKGDWLWSMLHFESIACRVHGFHIRPDAGRCWSTHPQALDIVRHLV